MMTKNKRRMATTVEPKGQTKAGKALAFVASFCVLSSVIVGIYFGYAPLLSWWESVEFQVVADAQPTVEAEESSETDDRNWKVAIDSDAQYVAAIELEEFLKEKLGDGFFGLDVNEAAEVLMSHPWIKTAVARKVWPETLLVEISEHEPWLNLNNKRLISLQGTVFEPDNIALFGHLPLLEGEFGELKDLLDMYHFFSEQIPSTEFEIRHLQFKAENGWAITLANGVHLYLGNQQLTERMERFFALLKEMNKHQQQKIAYVDLRYQSGAAIGWQEESSMTRVAKANKFIATEAI
ncbi:cell division protein FtsQ/DivIB [Pleionea sp. CnH1-48]|uniref:cell division protein FtsQ/DivIB n=1 Tax=Pleionea sp. CnH1-48 TaxID=2954494 RepID=UPI00209783F0|nr:cell division protein FtsQ/DivIB [Pleionea sp. CnH1-48]MCO7223989.1 cell division protein FtsQ/DivIB [Pleionea sp. CnH1-48]